MTSLWYKLTVAYTTLECMGKAKLNHLDVIREQRTPVFACLMVDKMQQRNKTDRAIRNQAIVISQRTRGCSVQGKREWSDNSNKVDNLSKRRNKNAHWFGKKQLLVTH